jgi:thioredoxin 1
MIKILRAYAEWCGPCKLLSPIFDELKQTFPKVEFVDVDVDQDVDFALKYSVRSVPMVVFEKDGVVVNKIVGLQSKQKYVENINSLLS